jgi:hypothetical protein
LNNQTYVTNLNPSNKIYQPQENSCGWSATGTRNPSTGWLVRSHRQPVNFAGKCRQFGTVADCPDSERIFRCFPLLVASVADCVRQLASFQPVNPFTIGDGLQKLLRCVEMLAIDASELASGFLFNPSQLLGEMQN